MKPTEGNGRSDVLNARHLVADAHSATIAVAGHIARALAWQVGDEPAVIADLEAALPRLAGAQRMLHESIAELRRATATTEG